MVILVLRLTEWGKGPSVTYMECFESGISFQNDPPGYKVTRLHFYLLLGNVVLKSRGMFVTCEKSKSYKLPYIMRLNIKNRIFRYVLKCIKVNGENKTCVFSLKKPPHSIECF